MTTAQAAGDVLVTARDLAARLEPRLSPEDREDLVAEVVAKYWNRWGGEDCPDNLEAWLTRTIRTTAIDEARARAARPQRHEAEDVVALLEHRLVTLGPSALVIGGADVKALLARLSGPDQQVVQSPLLHRVPAARVARDLGISVAAVDQRLSRAKRRMRQVLEDDPALLGGLRAGFPRVY